MKLLIIDDEPIALKSLKRLFRRRGIDDCDLCDNGPDALQLLAKKHYDVVLLDIVMPGMDGMQVLETAVPTSSTTEFIMLTAVDDIGHAVRATKLGAYDYLVKPINNERLLLTVERAFERKGLKAGIGAVGDNTEIWHPSEYFRDFITRSSRMRSLFTYIEVMAASYIPILIYGETGTGKELVAHGIHRASRYASGPFIAVNMSSIPDALFESHFFGHARGAFTGADNYVGYFEQANGGTLFLDEVGDLPLSLQPKLLRVLEDKTFNRLGDNKPIKVDVRIISASNKNLEAECRANRFRTDLLFRLKSAFIPLPPLRERPTDIPLLAEHFLKEIGEKMGKPEMHFSPEAVRKLMLATYPGNARELQQMVTNAILLAEDNLIGPDHFNISNEGAEVDIRTLSSLKENEEMHIAYVLKQTGENKNEACRILGLSLRQLQRKIAALRTQAPKD